MTDDHRGALDGSRGRPGTQPLTVAGGLATGVYGLVAAFLIAGIAAKTSMESATMFAMTAVSAIPLAILVAIMVSASGRRSAIGRWICILLGTISFLAQILLITS